MMISLPETFETIEGAPLSEYTTLKVGGRAERLVPVRDQREFLDLLGVCRRRGVRFFPLGGGSNVFFSDKGFRGVIALIRFSRLKLEAGGRVRAEAGISLERITRLCLRHSLTGFEFATGIPGTLGGAIYGNAGAYGRAIGDILVRARIAAGDGRVREVGRDYFGFAYRHSRLKEEPAFVLDADLQLAPGDLESIRGRVREIADLRRVKLPPWSTPTAGSYFKNIKDETGSATAAAIYLEAVESKKASVGDAAVHPKHANIFYNKGRATAADILALEELLRSRVWRRFGICLEREVIYVE